MTPHLKNEPSLRRLSEPGYISLYRENTVTNAVTKHSAYSVKHGFSSFVASEFLNKARKRNQ